MEEWIYCRSEKKQVDTAEHECCQGNSENIWILEQIISWNLHLDFGLFKFEYPTADVGGPAVTSRWVATIRCNYVCSEYYPELLLCSWVMKRFTIPYHNSNMAWNCISHRTSVNDVSKFSPWSLAFWIFIWFWCCDSVEQFLIKEFKIYINIDPIVLALAKKVSVSDIPILLVPNFLRPPTHKIQIYSGLVLSSLHSSSLIQF